MPLSKLQSKAAEKGTGKNLHSKENSILWPKVQVAKTGSVNWKADLQLLWSLSLRAETVIFVPPPPLPL